MKVKIYEIGDTRLEIDLDPENLDEVLMLLRYAMNAKMEKPSYYFGISKHDSGRLNIVLKKKAETVQKTCIYKY